MDGTTACTREIWGCGVADILDLIDNCLEDLGTSADAMRWTPDAAEGEIEKAARLFGVPSEILAPTGWRIIPREDRVLHVHDVWLT